MGGVVGRLLREFAVTITAAILVSGFMSISLTPMLCSRFLRPPREERHGWLYAHSSASSTPGVGLRRHPGLGAAIPGGHDGRVGRAARRDRLPVRGRAEGLPASEDQGRFNVNTEAAQGISFNDMVQHQLKVADVILKSKCVQRRRERRADGQQRHRRREHRTDVRRAEAAVRAHDVGGRGHRRASPG